MNREPQKKKSQNIPGILIFLFIMLASSGNIFILFALLPLVVVLLAMYFAYQKQKTGQTSEQSFDDLKREVYSAAGTVGKELRRAKETIERELLSDDEDAADRFGRDRTANAQPPQNAFDFGGEKPASVFGKKGSVNQEMFDASERRHLQSLSGEHNELLHMELELKDLLNAGIIERDEYNDRLRALKTRQR